MLTYTAWHAASGRQCIGVATSTSPLGPFVPRLGRPLICPTSIGGAIDAATYVENGVRYLLYKNDGNAVGQDTWLWLQRVTTDGLGLIGSPVRLIRQDRPEEGGLIEAPVLVRGSRVRYEAERGRLNHCVVRTGAAGASQGAVVAYIDYPDSWFEVDVFAPVAGAYTVHIGYANGSPATATHTLTVNGGAPVTATYPVTGWDNWRQASVGVQLTAGFNRIRLAKGAWYAEVDYLEVA